MRQNVGDAARSGSDQNYPDLVSSKVLLVRDTLIERDEYVEITSSPL